MGKVTAIQMVITALLSSGLVGGFITLVSKKVWSPESENELARIGNEFAQKLLEDARTEREELRTTIRELENGMASKEQTIDRLKRLADDKDAVIRLLEDRQYIVARKLQLGEIITVRDIFGPETPDEFLEQFNQRTNGKTNALPAKNDNQKEV